MAERQNRNRRPLFLGVGQSMAITLELTDGPLRAGAVRWSSSKPVFATVSLGGELCGLRPGRTTITVACKLPSGKWRRRSRVVQVLPAKEKQ